MLQPKMEFPKVVEGEGGRGGGEGFKAKIEPSYGQYGYFLEHHIACA